MTMAKLPTNKTRHILRQVDFGDGQVDFVILLARWASGHFQVFLPLLATSTVIFMRFPLVLGA
jgi:hypothetical protein